MPGDAGLPHGDPAMRASDSVTRTFFASPECIAIAATDVAVAPLAPIVLTPVTKLGFRPMYSPMGAG